MTKTSQLLLSINDENKRVSRKLSQALELLERFRDHAEEDLSGFRTMGACYYSEVEEFLREVDDDT